MSDDIVENLTRPSVWLRILFMIGFAVALYVTGFILLILVFAQILFSLFAGTDNDNLRRFGAALTEYIRQILLYLTFNSEHRPFPFAPFPLLDMNEVANDQVAREPPGPTPPPAAETSHSTTAAATVTPGAAAQTAPPEPSLPPDPELAEAQARQADITASTAAAAPVAPASDNPAVAETSEAPVPRVAPGEPTIPPPAETALNTLQDMPGEPTLPPGADQATTEEKVVDDYSENHSPDKPAGG